MAAPQPVTRSSLVLISVFALAGMVVLVGLGTWQLQRLAWKEALIERINARLKEDPVTLSQALERKTRGENVDFVRVKVRGTYDHEKAQYFYALSRGELGWRVLTPLVAEGRAPLLIDRGFVPDPQKPLKASTAPKIAEVIGALRLEYLPKVLFTPDNAPATNSWYWFDIAALRNATGRPGLAPTVVQLDTPDHSGAWPKAAALSPNMSNKHFGYALTWFGLAITLLGVYIAFIVQERRKRSSP